MHACFLLFWSALILFLYDVRSVRHRMGPGDQGASLSAHNRSLREPQTMIGTILEMGLSTVSLTYRVIAHSDRAYIYPRYQTLARLSQFKG